MKNEFLKIYSGKMTHAIAFTEVLRIESRGAYTVTYTIKGEKFTCCKNLSSMSKLVNEKEIFFRTHKSHLINLKMIKQYRTTERGVVMECGTVIPISKRRKAEFHRKYADL